VDAKAHVDDLQLTRDRALARRMLGGEQRAVREFCDTYLPRLYRFALQRVASPADADDVVQIVLSTAARRIETFRGDATLYSWLVAICRHEAGRYAAAAAARQSVMETDPDESALERLEAPPDEAPEALSSDQQQAARVRGCLARLPERYAEALELKYMDGYSTREIAGKFAISDTAVQSLLARARQSFREVCDHELREEIERSNGADHTRSSP
jgi:RNA polymerase sigma-70 factor (ECF subfamily)